MGDWLMFGRMIVSLKGTELLPKEEDIIKHPMTAGIILFAENLSRNPRELLTKLTELISKIQSISIASGKTAGLPIFVDQEGGFVQRLGKGFTIPLPSLEVLGTTYGINPETGLQLAKTYGERMAKSLMQLGIISLCPVLDLDAGNEVITGLGRAFHSDPKSCAELAAAYIDGMNVAGMRATGKHFPGHGQHIGDSHRVLPTDHRTLKEIEAQDLIPFVELIKNRKLAAIMPAHIKYPKIDAENTAGMSKIWLEKFLRKKYGFDGIIVSDCLSMAGAGSDSSLDKTKKALEYGDIALLCHKEPEEILDVLDGINIPQYQMSEQTEKRFNYWVEGSISIYKSLAQQEQVARPVIFSSNPTVTTTERSAETALVENPVAADLKLKCQ
jgi:beta-N-acetylhexosaminidase